MKKLSVLMLISAFIISAGQVFSQKLKSGDLTVLKGQTTVNLKYDYSSMEIGKFKNEKSYIENGIKDRNNKKPGSGDEWAVKWESDKTDRFQPTFERNLNAKLLDIGMKAEENAVNAKYTLIVKTVFMEPGFQSGVGISKPAYINMIVDLVETSNQAGVVGQIEYNKIQSVNMMGYDFDTGGRIQSCYDRAGDNIGKLILKTLSK